MSNLKFTPAQTDAINARSGDVLVSAAAGSGKTAVLVQRIIEAMTAPENPVSIDRMLIVTFTNLATKEMRDRIEQAINNLLLKDPYNSYLLSQKQLLYTAKISTIDGFCTEFVREYFYKLGIQRDFRIAEETEQKVFKAKALDRAMNYFYSNGDNDFLDLVSLVCSYRGDSELRAHAETLFRFTSAFPFPKMWLDLKLRYYDKSDVPFAHSPCFDYIMRFCADCLFYCLELNSNCLEHLENNPFPEHSDNEKLRDFLLSDFSFLNTCSANASNGDWDALCCMLSEIELKRFPKLKCGKDDPDKVFIQSTRDNMKKELSKLSPLFKKTLAQIEAETEKIYPAIRCLFSLVKKFSDEYKALKYEKDLLDFSDIEHLTIELLCENNGGEITFTKEARELSKSFDLIMVDEFQDVNETQDLLFRAVSCGRENLFVVGDVKQSIYGFRQANPDIFTGYKNRYQKYDSESGNYPAKIVLDKNFRSRKGVTEACNFVFGALMSESFGGIGYDDEEKLVCGAEYENPDSPCVELIMVDCGELSKEEEETKEELEASKVAEKILSLVYEDKPLIQDKNGLRPVQFGDIAVLMRSTKGEARRAEIFTKVFTRYAIPTISDERNNFFDESEIMVMLNLLRVIDNPVQDIPLLSVLMSPIFGFDADELSAVRANNRRSSLYAAIKSRGDNPKCQNFLSFLSRMRTLSVTMRVDSFIAEAMKTSGFESLVSAQSIAGAKNLYLLLEYARGFCENGYRTLSSFVSFIDRMNERKIKLNSSALTDGENLNAVSVISVHGSKGLEFPVCFLSATSTEFNLRDAGSSFVFNSEGGVGIRYTENLIRYDTVQRRGVSMMMRDASVAEELRILYVAMTRAREKLFVTSAVKNPESYLEKLRDKITSFPISPYVVKNAGSFSDWIFMCALLHPNCPMPVKSKVSVLGEGEAAIPWKFTIADKDVEIPEAGELSLELPAQDAADMEFLKKFEERASFEYPDKVLTTLPQKVSASQLSHLGSSVFEKILSKPKFLSEKKISGAEAGTAFHRFMEFCDLKAARDDCEAEAHRLCEKGFLGEEEANLLDFKKLSAFLSSELIDRVLRSERYEREYTFTVKISARDYNPDIDSKFSDRKIIMQGAVDLVFVEDGRAVIVDYKTDRVGDVQKLRDLYQKQLELYKAAVSETMNLPVKETVIYSIYLGEKIVTNN